MKLLEKETLTISYYFPKGEVRRAKERGIERQADRQSVCVCMCERERKERESWTDRQKE